MSSENGELVRSIYAAWERGDFSSAQWADPAIEFVSADGPAPGTWTGVSGMAESWGEVLSAFDALHVKVDEYRALDDHRILVLFRFCGRGKTSGLDLGQMQPEVANLLFVREGKVTRLVTYWDRDRALSDLGLTPEEPHDAR
jgi:ketosteroid isomerase-like protein